MTVWDWTLQRLRAWIALPQVLALVVVINIAAYVAGLLFWYGDVMGDPATPWWAWLFIPDCPLFALLGGLGLLMVVAQRHWSPEDQRRGQRALAVAALLSVPVWLSTGLPGVAAGWAQQNAMLAVWTLVLALGAIWFTRPPVWLLGIFALGQIKYGIWTITAWLLYWDSTAKLLGAPHFSVDSVAMTVTHVGLALQGVLLLAYFRPTRTAALAGLLWFGASDFVDYGLGFHPAIPPEFISLTVLQWSTIAVTLVMSAWYFRVGLRARSRPAVVEPSTQPV